MADVQSSQNPVFESPVVAKYPMSSAGDLTLADVSAITKWLVRADADGPTADQLGAAFGTSQVAVGGALVLGSRPGEWIVLGTSEEVSAAVAGIEQLDGPDASEFVSALDWTHGRALSRVTGRGATRMLEKVCSLDWSDPMTPDGAVASASVAKVTCDIARNDADGAPSYLIFCDRSFGQYLFDALLDAGDEFDISVIAAAT